MDTIVNYYLRVENWIKEIKVPPPESITDFTVHTYQSVASFITTHGMAVTALALGIGMVMVSRSLLKTLYDKDLLSSKLAHSEFWGRIHRTNASNWKLRFWETREKLDELAEDSHKRITALKESNTVITANYYSIASEFEKCLEENSDLEETVIDLKDKITDLEDKVSELEDQVDNLGSEVECAREDEAYEERRADGFFEELTDLRQKFSNIQAANDAYAELVVELKAA